MKLAITLSRSFDYIFLVKFRYELCSARATEFGRALGRGCCPAAYLSNTSFLSSAVFGVMLESVTFWIKHIYVCVSATVTRKVRF